MHAKRDEALWTSRDDRCGYVENRRKSTVDGEKRGVVVVSFRHRKPEKWHQEEENECVKTE